MLRGFIKDRSFWQRDHKKVKTKQDSGCRKVSSQISENAKERMEVLEMECHMGVRVQAKYVEMEDLRKQEESRQLRFLKAKEDLLAAEEELAKLPIFEPPRNDIINFLMWNVLKVYHWFKDMESKNTKLLQALRYIGADRILEAYNWSQEHRNELKKEVYGPVLIEVNVQNLKHAAYLEQHVPNYIWKSFITQDTDDRDFLLQNLRPFDVPILNYLGDSSGDRISFQISDEFVGTHETDQRADEISKFRIFDLWTPENHYRWSVSRYGGHISASVEAVFRS
ncbi:hypothetical protein J5N97_017588 [Dioscorea zingiberensis]|uniref:Uncharacterized protein n=1 Tax=Dioscorea zingiberensis TaxID=325984 RepID=A0A9D5CNH5_9LILI|nr:hypothetical protein J5N97_017588 [Dioscorea zingiberensis]